MASSRFPDPIPGILPFGTVTLFAGAPGVGKTAMLADWIQRWRTGRTICGKPTNPPTGFYYLAADRQWASHQQWFDAVGYPDIPRYTITDDRKLRADLEHPRNALNVLAACINVLDPRPGGHLVIDPISPLFIKGDPNKPRDVAISMLKLSELCADREITITCTAHFSKQKTDPREQYTRPQDRISGSGAFSGFTDTQIYLIDPVPPKQPHHLLGWVPRHAKPEEHAFVRNESGLFVPAGLFLALDKREKAAEVIPFEPTKTSIVVALIEKALDISTAQAERYLKSLVADDTVIRVKQGVYQRRRVN